MSVINEKFEIITKGFDDALDITSKIEHIVAINNIDKAQITITSTSSCVSIVTLELEPALEKDLFEILDTIVPLNKLYKHDSLWYEGNAYSHLKASILGKSVVLGVADGKMCLGNYQRIVLMDFDNKSQTREIIVTIVY